MSTTPLPDEMGIDCGAFGKIRRTSPPARGEDAIQEGRLTLLGCIQRGLVTLSREELLPFLDALDAQAERIAELALALEIEKRMRKAYFKECVCKNRRIADLEIEARASAAAARVNLARAEKAESRVRGLEVELVRILDRMRGRCECCGRFATHQAHATVPGRCHKYRLPDGGHAICLNWKLPAGLDGEASA